MEKPNPYELAKRREYRRRWWDYAWAESVEFERRWGFRISAALATLAAVSSYFWAGSKVNIGLAILSALTALAIYLVGVLVWQLITAPSRLAFIEHKREEGLGSEDDLNRIQSSHAPEIEGGPGVVEFTTIGKGDRDVELSFFRNDPSAPLALRFSSRKGDVVVRADTPFPVDVWLPWRGRLLIKGWTAAGLVIGEECSAGRPIRFEVYR